jgi:hypothetical protein
MRDSVLGNKIRLDKAKVFTVNTVDKPQPLEFKVKAELVSTRP